MIFSFRVFPPVFIHSMTEKNSYFFFFHFHSIRLHFPSPPTIPPLPRIGNTKLLSFRFYFWCNFSVFSFLNEKKKKEKLLNLLYSSSMAKSGRKEQKKFTNHQMVAYGISTLFCSICERKVVIWSVRQQPATYIYTYLSRKAWKNSLYYLMAFYIGRYRVIGNNVFFFFFPYIYNNQKRTE